MRRSCAANSGPTRCADGRWLASGGVGRLFLNIVEVGGEKARCGVPKLASSGMHATTGSRETHSHEAKSRWDRGRWIMMDDDHGLNQDPRVGRGRNRFPRHASFRSFSTSNLTVCCGAAACWVDLRLPKRVRIPCCPGEKVDNFLDLDMAFGGRITRNNDFSLCGTAARARGRVIILVNSGHT